MTVQQFAALPYRSSRPGEIEVLLITSKHSKRWIIPKGWPMGALAPHCVAAREAFEEAGLEGIVSRHPLGTYTYAKIKRRRALPCEVQVFPLKVSRQHAAWPEKGQRRLRWSSLEEAVSLIDDKDLRPLLHALADLEAARG